MDFTSTVQANDNYGGDTGGPGKMITVSQKILVFHCFYVIVYSFYLSRMAILKI